MSARIVTLEEDPVRVAELRLALERAGHRLFSFASYDKALNFLRHSHTDLILCDVYLERASSFDFLSAVKENSPAKNAPFVFYCIKPTMLLPFGKDPAKKILATARKLGADAVIFSENFEVSELSTGIARFLPERLGRKCA